MHPLAAAARITSSARAARTSRYFMAAPPGLRPLFTRSKPRGSRTVSKEVAGGRSGRAVELRQTAHLVPDVGLLLLDETSENVVPGLQKIQNLAEARGGRDSLKLSHRP